MSFNLSKRESVFRLEGEHCRKQHFELIAEVAMSPWLVVTMSAPELIQLIFYQRLIELVTKLSSVEGRMLSHHNEEDHSTSEQVNHRSVIRTLEDNFRRHIASRA